MINVVLTFILLLLMLYVSKNRGLKLFISLIFNFIITIISFYFIALGFNPIIVALISCLLISYVILFYVNGDNIKTRTSMISIFIILIVLLAFIFLMTEASRIAGFGEEAFEEINMFSYDIGMNFTNISIALILIGLIGALIDASIAISSALYEIHQNNKKLEFKELVKSGMNVGRDIIGTSTNTILFAFLGEFMTLIIWFKFCNYSGLEVINSKAFSMEIIKIIFSTLGCLYVIPVTSYITSKKLKIK